jgi:hypothetical protein
MPNGDTETVQFKSPTTGAVKPLGSEDWEAALSRGYKPVDHTIMFSPEGKRGFVPNAELRDYMGQGYQTTPETQFEKDRPGHGITSEGAGTAALETAKGIPGGILKLLDPTEPFRHPSDIPIVRSIREMGAAAKDPDARWWEVPVAGAGSLFGMSAESAVRVEVSWAKPLSPRRWQSVVNWLLKRARFRESLGPLKTPKTWLALLCAHRKEP